MSPSDASENWDEDFEFNGNAANSHSDTKPSPSSPRRSNPSTPHSKDRRSSLNTWAEPGPSTPLQRLQQAENWDDDFQDADSPGPRKSSRTHNGGARAGGSSSPVENWDDEFEDGTTRTHASPRKRTPRKRPSWPSSDEEDEFGFADREDDRTVTTRSRGVPFHLPTEIPPPVPPLPSPFPHSVAGYSYSSTAHLALRPTVSGSSAAVAARLALLPPSPPIHRERRRLRKKSRPPPNFEEGIFELDDRAELAEQARPVTPENPKKTREVPATTLDDPPPDVGNTSTTKTPLLSRIGSVGKKWGTGRKKRASTGPSEVALRERDESSHERERQPDSERSRPTSFVASSSPGHSGAKSWFFRGGGGGQGPGSPPRRETALKHENSVERLLHLMGVERGRERDPGSPRSAKSKSLHTRDGTGSSALPEDLEEAVDGNGLPASALLFGGGTPRRPTSMQVSISNGSSGSSWSNRPPVPRHVSYNDSRPRRPATPSSRASSKQRSASASVEDVHRAKKSSTTTRETADDHSSDAHNSALPEKAALEDQKGSRRFMGGIRRISLVGSKHKRTKSITAEDKDKEKRPKRPGTASSAHETDASQSHDQSTPRPPSRVVRSSQDVPLLPPIELQPPSPPRNKAPRKPLVLDSANLATPTRSSIDRTLETSRSHPTLSSKSSTQTTSTETALATIPSPLPSPTRPRGSTSPVQTASLGRTALPPKEREGTPSSAVLRRNSLGDLKIPARISQAQVSLKRDLTMVRDFATSVEQLKQLQLTYTTLVGQVRALINEPQESQSRPVSPSFIHFPKPSSRLRANTNPPTNNGPTRSQVNTAFLNIEAKYRLSWECAELLIDLAGGGGDQPTSPPPSSQSAPVVPTTTIDGRKSRERAITLAGDEPKPAVGSSHPGPTSPPLASPPPSQWRASTGRHDLSQRQLLLLREMLNNPDPSATMSLEPNIPEEDINRSWRWGDAMNSTVTLPSEESESMSGGILSPTKKQNTARRGMRHIREMLRRLKKNPGQLVIPQSSSSVSASTDSSLNLPRESRPQSVMSRRRAKTSTGPESIASRHPNSPYGTTPGLSHKSSPRRPSLASIFRLGQKSKTTNASVDDLSPNATGLPSSSSGMASGASLGDDEEDWDRIDSASDLDHAARAFGFSSDGTATVRGKKGRSPYLFQSRASDADTARRPPEASLSSLFAPGGESPKKPASAIPPSILENYTRSIKLSDVREHDTGDEGGPSQSNNSSGQSTRAPSRNKKRQSAPSPSPRRPPSRSRKNPTGSVRSAPPQPWGNPSPELGAGPLPLPDSKLAMAPENIKPLLENAREVHARCTDCIAELEALLGSGISVSA
ncbi:hypothetical protein C8T65DRAFT_744844 [Cerioporus squamosus]|nr:hypothetical protein C8T65DRAFT_744844 [Cerioporus squamosus]